jgi:malate synthase
MATGEIRLSILWEWLHKAAPLTHDDPSTGVGAGSAFTSVLLEKLLDEEYDKLLKASDRDVHDDSKRTTLPITREIVRAYLRERDKPPWYIDFLNANLGNHDLEEARQRICRVIDALRDGKRITRNLDFVGEE